MNLFGQMFLQCCFHILSEKQEMLESGQTVLRRQPRCHLHGGRSSRRRSRALRYFIIPETPQRLVSSKCRSDLITLRLNGSLRVEYDGCSCRGASSTWEAESCLCGSVVLQQRLTPTRRHFTPSLWKPGEEQNHSDLLSDQLQRRRIQFLHGRTSEGRDLKPSTRSCITSAGTKPLKEQSDKHVGFRTVESVLCCESNTLLFNISFIWNCSIFVHVKIQTQSFKCKHHILTVCNLN